MPNLATGCQPPPPGVDDDDNDCPELSHADDDSVSEADSACNYDSDDDELDDDDIFNLEQPGANMRPKLTNGKPT
jgi:hypothetical protein